MKNCFGIRSFVGNGPAGAFFMSYPDCFAGTHFTVQPTTYETKQGR